MRSAAALLLVAAAFAGCVHVQELPQADGSVRVEIENSGWYLFDVLPIATGDPEGGTAWFSDHCDAHANMRVLEPIIRRVGAVRVGPLVSHETDEGVLLILLNRHGFHTSVTLFPETDGRSGENE